MTIVIWFKTNLFIFVNSNTIFGHQSLIPRKIPTKNVLLLHNKNENIQQSLINAAAIIKGTYRCFNLPRIYTFQP